MPQGEQIWPAFLVDASRGYSLASGGGLDIMEHRGRIANTASSALHFGEKFDKKAAFVGAKKAVVPNKVNFQKHFTQLHWSGEGTT